MKLAKMRRGLLGQRTKAVVLLTGRKGDKVMLAGGSDGGGDSGREGGQRERTDPPLNPGLVQQPASYRNWNALSKQYHQYRP